MLKFFYAVVLRIGRYARGGPGLRNCRLAGHLGLAQAAGMSPYAEPGVARGQSSIENIGFAFLFVMALC